MNRRKFLINFAGLMLLPETLPNVFRDDISSANTGESRKSLETKFRLLPAYAEVHGRFDVKENEPVLIVDGENQRMYLMTSDSQEGLKINEEYRISTSIKGFGNRHGSKKTPTGIHRIIEKYGENSPAGTVFVARMNTRRLARPNKKGFYDDSECITSRILQLDGCERDNRNTYSRCVYIHGVPDKRLIQKPSSEGCILMTDRDVIRLFGLVNTRTYVNIKEFL